MKILLLGHKGAVGKEFINLFKLKKIKYFTVKKNHINHIFLKKLIRSKNISHIINCIGKTKNCDIDIKNAYKTNVDVPRIICNAIKNFSVRLIHFSTKAVFFSNKTNQVLTEKAIPRPKSIYGITKLLGEREVLKSRNSLIVRLPSLFGPTHYNDIYNKLFNKLKKNRKVYASTNAYSTPVYTPDLCNFILSECIKKKKYFNKKLIHFSGKDNFSIYEFIKKIADLNPKILNSNLIYPVKETFFTNTKINNLKNFQLGSIYPELIKSINYKNLKL